MNSQSFKRGDMVVSASPEQHLDGGPQVYSRAVVVQARPLVLVSEDCNMRWERTVLPPTLRVVGQATPNLLARCIARL